MSGDGISQEFIVELTRKMDKLCLTIEQVKERQDEMLDNVAKIKEAVYNPDSGIYARLRELEQWKAQQQKKEWAVMVTLIGLVTATVYKTIFPMI